MEKYETDTVTEYQINIWWDWQWEWDKSVGQTETGQMRYNCAKKPETVTGTEHEINIRWDWDKYAGQTGTSLRVNVSATQLMRLGGLAGASGNGDWESAH